MSIIHLSAADLIDPHTDVRYARHHVNDLLTTAHDHDFCEVFLIVEGSITHVVNGESVPLTAGALVFIRPADQHYYENDGSDGCTLINFAIAERTIGDLFTYLGVESRGRGAGFYAAERPPMVQLSLQDRHFIIPRLERLSTPPVGNNASYRMEARVLLADLFALIMTPSAVSAPMPGWMVELLDKMEQKEHFVGGLESLYSLAHRSPEHIAREFKRYLGVTPSHYINRQRLTYAANLLLHSDQSILEIALDAGFENLSYFYRCFKKHYGVSPHQYRLHNLRQFIP